MTAPAPRHTGLGWRLLGLFGVVLGTALGSAVLTAMPASAHATLVSSDPAAGTVLTSAPAQVSLVFSDELNPALVTVTLTGSDGAQRELAAPQVDGTTLTQPLPAVSGDAVVAYRIVSADGHPVQGTVDFTVDVPAAAATTPGASTTTPTTAASTTPAPTTTPAPSSAVTAATAPASQQSSGVPVWVFLAVGAVVVATVGGLLVRRSYRS